MHVQRYSYLTGSQYCRGPAGVAADDGAGEEDEE